MVGRLTAGATGRKRRATASLSLSLVLAAAPPLDPSLVALQAADARLARVAFRLQTANTDVCAPVVSLPGFTIVAASQLGAAERARWADQLRLGDQPGIGAIAPDSEAWQLGLRVGDRLIAIDGAPTPGPDSRRRYAQVGATEDRLEAALSAGPARLLVGNGITRTVALSGNHGCPSRVQLVGGGLQATSADGRYIQISQRMFEIATAGTASDDALAAIVAHELAHNVLRHNALKTPSKQAEYEADALSVRLVVRAGYDLNAVLPFWESLRKRTDYGIFADGSHPGWRKRIAALAAAVAAAKEAASQPTKAR